MRRYWNVVNAFRFSYRIVSIIPGSAYKVEHCNFGAIMLSQLADNRRCVRQWGGAEAAKLSTWPDSKAGMARGYRPGIQARGYRPGDTGQGIQARG